MTTPPPLVRVEHVSKTYRRSGWLTRGETSPAVDDVSFEIAVGETLGLVGRSGSGKTTIGRVIMRLVEPSAGRVIVTPRGGRPTDLMALSRAELRRFRRYIQMVFQDPQAALNPRLTVRQMVEEPIRIHRVVPHAQVRDRCREVLEQVGLDPGVADDRPGTLSGGQRQRVVIARAIASEPCFIVADEPVTALDVSVQAQILNLLADLKKQFGLSYLFISHDLAVVEHVADRVAVLAEGRLVEVGETRALLECPQHPATRRLVEASRRSLRSSS